MALSIPVNTDDIAIIAPPDTITLSVDIGPTGQRGSKVFVGSGDPNTKTFTETIYLNDVYINVSPGTNYSYMYQYISSPGGNQWENFLKINPAIHSRLVSTNNDFIAGEATISVPISSIATVAGSPLVASDFNVQYSIQNSNPIASSISDLSVSGSNLNITIKAVESNSGTWSDFVATDVPVSLFISVNTTVV